MTPAQRKAVATHRNRQAKKGMSRLEIAVPEADKPLFRQLAGILRKGGQRAERLRRAIETAATDAPKMSFLEYLASGPDIDLEIPERKVEEREIDL